MWKVGHSLIKAKMKEEKAALAGEMSGHMFFADRWFGFDDAVYAAMRLVELLTPSKQTLAELYDTLPVLHNTPEIRDAVPRRREVRGRAARRGLVPRALPDRRRRRRARHLPGTKGSGGAARTSAGAWCAPRTPAPCWSCGSRPTRPARLAEIKALMEGRLRQIIADVTTATPS